MNGWVDAMMAICEASEAGRPYSVLTSKEPPQPRSDEAQRVIREMQRTAQRLHEHPEFAERESERAKRLAATIAAIEREQRERDAA
jgi:hypothetical protein